MKNSFQTTVPVENLVFGTYDVYFFNGYSVHCTVVLTELESKEYFLVDGRNYNWNSANETANPFTCSISHSSCEVIVKTNRFAFSWIREYFFSYFSKIISIKKPLNCLKVWPENRSVQYWRAHDLRYEFVGSSCCELFIVDGGDSHRIVFEIDCKGAGKKSKICCTSAAFLCCRAGFMCTCQAANSFENSIHFV